MNQDRYLRFYINLSGEINNNIKGYAKIECVNETFKININLLGLSNENQYSCYIINCKNNILNYKNIGYLILNDNRGTLTKNINENWIKDANIITILDNENNYIATGYKNGRCIWKPRFEENLPKSSPSIIDNLILNNEICDETQYNNLYKNKITNLKNILNENFAKMPKFSESLDIDWWKINDFKKIINILNDMNCNNVCNFIKQYMTNVIYNDFIVGIDFNNDGKYYLICGISAIYGIDPKPQDFDSIWCDGYWIVGIEI